MSITDPWAAWALVADEKGRLKDTHRKRGLEIRCNKGHLVAWLLPTVQGTLWARRNPWVEHDAANGWEAGWASEDGPQTAHCPSCQRTWLLDPGRADLTQRRLAPADLRADTRTHAMENEPSTADPFD